MITRMAQQVHYNKEQMRGGEKYVQFTDLSSQVPERVRVYSILRLIPGATIGYHVHEGETELFYFLEGSGQVQDDDQIVDIQAGDSMATFSGHGHGVMNTGDQDLVLLACIVKD